MKKVLFIVFTFAIAFDAAAEIYKCERSDGSIEFSQKPCDKTAQSQEVIIHKKIKPNDDKAKSTPGASKKPLYPSSKKEPSSKKQRKEIPHAPFLGPG